MTMGHLLSRPPIKNIHRCHWLTQPAQAQRSEREPATRRAPKSRRPRSAAHCPGGRCFTCLLTRLFEVCRKLLDAQGGMEVINTARTWLSWLGFCLLALETMGERLCLESSRGETHSSAGSEERSGGRTPVR